MEGTLLTDTYVLAAFTVMQKRSMLYVERKTTEAIAACVKGCLESGADYISIRRIRNE